MSYHIQVWDKSTKVGEVLGHRPWSKVTANRRAYRLSAVSPGLTYLIADQFGRTINLMRGKS